MSGKKKKNPIESIKVSNAIYPVAIGLGVAVFMFLREFDLSVFDQIHLSWKSAFWIFVAMLCMVGRDLGYVMRLRIISDYQITWRKSLQAIMLWEFTSAITPSAVGGTSIATVYVHKAGLSVGKSASAVLLTSFLDEVYFILMFPLVVVLVGKTALFNISDASLISGSLVTIALTGYFMKLAYVLLVSYGLFINPRGLKMLIIKTFRLKPLRRWQEGAVKAGAEIVTSSYELKHKGLKFWSKVMGTTILSWSSRYLVANALMLALFSVSDHLLLFARQLVMWIMMLVTPTPGGSGFAEYLFRVLCVDMVKMDGAMQLSAITLLALMWRAVTYYPYIIIGISIFPSWLKRNFKKAPKSA